MEHMLVMPSGPRVSQRGGTLRFQKTQRCGRGGLDVSGVDDGCRLALLIQALERRTRHNDVLVSLQRGLWRLGRGIASCGPKDGWGKGWIAGGFRFLFLSNV